MIKKLLLTAATLCMALSASAQNRDKCYWMQEQSVSPFPDTASRTGTLTFPQSQELKLVKIGQSMGGAPLSYYLKGHKFIQCPSDTVPRVSIAYWLSGAALVPGYSDVYSTNLPGVGLRITALRNPPSTIPLNDSYQNSTPLAISITNFHVDFIRTADKIGTGSINLNLDLYARFHDWTALTLSATGSILVTTNEYFSGCAGAPTTNIRLGKVNAQDLAQNKRSFNLEVVCAGAPAGSKLPVKVYFEGSNSGPGRLNLTPGGATGVEIAVTSNSMNLPFSVGSALNMDWLRTESGGERYTLPIVAGYERIGNSKVEVGKADATMNYVLEYN